MGGGSASVQISWEMVRNHLDLLRFFCLLVLLLLVLLNVLLRFNVPVCSFEQLLIRLFLEDPGKPLDSSFALAASMSLPLCPCCLHFALDYAREDGHRLFSPFPVPLLTSSCWIELALDVLGDIVEGLRCDTNILESQQ